MSDWVVVLEAIGGFIVVVSGIWLAWKKFPREMKQTDISLAQSAYTLAQQAIKDRKEDGARIDELEKKIDAYEETIKDNKVAMKLKEDRIEELERKVRLLEDMLASQRVEFEERLTLQRDEYERQIGELQKQLGSVKRTTDELKEKK